jgi:threonine/homoserine/homoserine lactone efflux protein
MFFLASSLALLLLPGPAVFYIVARSVAQGREAGLVSALGVGLGSMVHVLAATLGISALLASSAEVFSALRLAGAAYLVYLGVRALMSGERRVRDARKLAVGGRRSVFREGVVVNLLNPKTAIFFVAFLPQFANPAQGSVGIQILTLGCAFVTLGILTDSGYALAAHFLSRRITESPRMIKLRARFAAAVYFALGAVTLSVEAPRST